MKGLGQGAAIIGAQNRQYRHPLADLQVGLRDTHLAGNSESAKVIGRAAIAVYRQKLGAFGPFAAIEFDREQAEHIGAETHCALGEAGLGVEDEALGPFLGFVLVGRVANKVAVDIEVAQRQANFGLVLSFGMQSLCTHEQAGSGDAQAETRECVHYYFSFGVSRPRSR